MNVQTACFEITRARDGIAGVQHFVVTSFGVKDQPRRALAYQEVILRIGPFGKLGHFKSTAKKFFVYMYIASIILARGLILSIISWYAKVLHGSAIKVGPKRNFL